MRFVEQRVTPTFEEEERIDGAPMTHIVDTVNARVVALVAIEDPDATRLVLDALNRKCIAADLVKRFPWLANDDDANADVVDQLREWYEELRNG